MTSSFNDYALILISPAAEFTSGRVRVDRVWQEASSIPQSVGTKYYFLQGTRGAWNRLWSPAVNVYEG